MLPDPLFYTPAEPLMTSDESVCDPKERPGVHEFIKFVTKHQGGASGRTLGPCGGTSGHAAGRAWDWMIRADVPEQRAQADELIAWLLANGAEIFRRAGLSYIIWDKHVWSALRPEWRPYDGFDEDGKCTRVRCRDPHTNHVHFSFNWPGAEGETSFYHWLASGKPVQPPIVPPEPPAKPFRPVDFATRVVPLLAGAVLGFVGFERARERWRRA